MDVDDSRGPSPIVAIEAALFVVAVIVLWIPESRTLPVKLALTGLYLCLTACDLRLAHRTGMLRMTWRQIRETAGQRPRRSLLHFAASFLGLIAAIRILLP